MNTRRILPAALALALAACGGAETMEPAGPMPAPTADTDAYPTDPPAPTAVTDVQFPEFAERTLENGARLIVVENHEQPVVNVQLLMPGGSSADPEEMPGLASMTAAQIDQGTSTMSAAEIAEAVDFLGASLGAGASSEWSSVFLTTLTEFLDDGLDLMSDVVTDPVFPEDQLMTEKQRRISGLRLQKSQPAALAGEAFTKELYGDHPYGQTESVESIEAIDVDDLQAFHEAHYRPEDALFVVAGDVEPDAVAERLEAAFAGWEGSGAMESARVEPPTRTDRKLLFVHKPGSVQAVIRMGHLFPSATDADWPTLDLANQVLGSGSAGFAAWMNQTLREDRGYTYGAYSSMNERQGPGTFSMSGEFRNEVADSSLMIMIDLAERLRAGDIPASDLEAAKSYLTGSFPLGIETPQQVASQVASNRLLGRPDSYLTEYRGRVAAADAEDVARVTAETIHPDRMLIVVVGDATEVLDQVRPFADEVEVVDAEGDPVDVAELAASAERAASTTYDASGLQPRQMEYGIMFQGNEVGTIVTRWTRDGDVFAVVTEQQMPGMTLSQSTEFNPMTFAPLRTNVSAGAMGEFGLEVADGRVTGQGLDPQSGPQEVDLELPEGAVFSDQFEVAVALSNLADAGDVSLRVLTGAGQLQTMTATVDGEETIEVPAGTFETYRLQLEGQQPMTVWVTQSDPHIVVKREVAGQPVAIVLKSM